jgi:hypothetical protein
LGSAIQGSDRPTIHAVVLEPGRSSSSRQTCGGPAGRRSRPEDRPAARKDWQGQPLCTSDASRTIALV